MRTQGLNILVELSDRSREEHVVQTVLLVDADEKRFCMSGFKGDFLQGLSEIMDLLDVLDSDRLARKVDLRADGGYAQELGGTVPKRTFHVSPEENYRPTQIDLYEQRARVR